MVAIVGLAVEGSEKMEWWQRSGVLQWKESDKEVAARQRKQPDGGPAGSNVPPKGIGHYE